MYRGYKYYNKIIKTRESKRLSYKFHNFFYHGMVIQRRSTFLISTMVLVRYEEYFGFLSAFLLSIVAFFKIVLQSPLC